MEGKLIYIGVSYHMVVGLYRPAQKGVVVHIPSQSGHGELGSEQQWPLTHSHEWTSMAQ